MVVKALRMSRPSTNGRRLPLGLKIAAIYLLVAGAGGNSLPPVPSGPAPLAWLGTRESAGRHARVYVLDAAFAVCGAGILYPQ
jgi:hypothetical protein